MARTEEHGARRKKQILEAKKAFVWRIMVFVDKAGTVLHKEGSPMHSILEMEHVVGEIRFHFEAASYAQGNGGCTVEVRHAKKKVFAAHGSFMTMPFNVTIDAYEPGTWRKNIPRLPK